MIIQILAIINCYQDIKGYYLDRNDSIFKKCYYTCETCEIIGNNITHNCLSCNINFPFNMTYGNYINCYINMSNDFYNENVLNFTEYSNKHYSDENEISYHLKLINNISIIQRKISTSSNSAIIYECTSNDELNNNCDFLGVENNAEILNIIKENINSLYDPGNGKSQIIKGENNITFQITNGKNELESLQNGDLDNQNLSIIVLGECETTLRTVYHINDNISLIYIKQENTMAKPSEKNIQYEVFEPINFTKLNLSICNGNTINIYAKMDLSDETKETFEKMKSMGYNMFNIEDPFYQDICIPYSSTNNTDMLLSDRKDYIYNNKDTQCQPSCQFSSYLLNSSYMKCSCDAIIDNNKKDDKKFSGKKLYESFYEVLKYSNFQILKCYKLIFVKNVLLKILVVLLF